MSKIAALVLSLLISGTIVAQNNCQQAISNEQFQTKFSQLKSQSTDQKKLFIGKQLVKKYCFSSSQIKEMASIFDDDFSRLEFAKRAYENTVDKENYYDVYDAFIYYSVVFRLHDFILSIKTSVDNSSNDTNNANALIFPRYNYPDYNKYQGDKNCFELISNNDFIQLAKELNSIKNDQLKFNKASDIINSKCLSTEQLMQLASLIESENYRFSFAKEAYNAVSDIENYIEMKQVFNTPRIRAQFSQFINSKDITTEDACQVPDEKFNQIIHEIKIENFNSAKVTTAKHLIQQNDCFSAQQISSIVNIFDYENSKLEIAIFSYKFSNDKSNYYSVVSKALGFNSSKNKLLNYIKSQN